MKRKNFMFGVFLFGMLFLTANLTNSIAIEDDPLGDDKPEEPLEEPDEPDKPIEEPNDDNDDDGVDNNFEDDNNRAISI